MVTLVTKSSFSLVRVKVTQYRVRVMKDQVLFYVTDIMVYRLRLYNMR